MEKINTVPVSKELELTVLNFIVKYNIRPDTFQINTQ